MERFIKIFIPIMVVYLAIGIITTTFIPGLFVKKSDHITSNSYVDAFISFNYPPNWQIISQESGNKLVELGYVDKSNPTTYKVDPVVGVLKFPIPSSNTLQKTFKGSYELQMENDSSFKKISENQISVNIFSLFGGESEYKIVYETQSEGKAEKRIDMWIEKDGYIYVVRCSTSPSNFENQKQNFNIILDTFRIK